MAYLESEQLRKLGYKYIGSNVRVSDKASVYDCSKISIGKNSRIDDFCVISGNIMIGENVHIAPFCLVAGGEEGISFADFSGLAYGVRVFSQSDDYLGRTLTNPTVPDKYKKETKSKIHLGRHVIVGCNSVILPGVTIAEGCSVGAMSLVKKSTKEWGVYLGAPALRVAERKKDLLVLEKQYLLERKNDSI